VINFKLSTIHYSLLTNEAVFFYGTILTLTRTGRYPASLIFWKPGLSSDSPKKNLQLPRQLSPSSSVESPGRFRD